MKKIAIILGILLSGGISIEATAASELSDEIDKTWALAQQKAACKAVLDNFRADGKEMHLFKKNGIVNKQEVDKLFEMFEQMLEDEWECLFDVWSERARVAKDGLREDEVALREVLSDYLVGTALDRGGGVYYEFSDGSVLYHNNSLYHEHLWTSKP